MSRLADLRGRAEAGGGCRQWAVERGLQLAAEIALDVGNHILSAHFGVSATSYEDIVRRLGDLGVLPDDVRASIQGLGGFRDVLVHGYFALDETRVAEQLDVAPERFTAFAVAVRRWLEQAVG